MDSSSKDTPVILVTGFGPFGCHSENASQKVVEHLQSLNIESELGVKLHTGILDVDYNYVLGTVTDFWRKLNPKLVVHIGVSSISNNISLERQASNCDYMKSEFGNCIPCISDLPACIETELDLDMAVHEAKKQVVPPQEICLSSDPGRFLCGFVYYLSLNISKDRSLFIHVPTLQNVHVDPQVATRRLTNIIATIIKCLYTQVCEKPSLRPGLVEEVLNRIKLRELSEKELLELQNCGSTEASKLAYRII